MGSGTVDVDFFKKSERGFIFLFGKFAYLLVGSSFLIKELIRGESQNFQPSATELIVHFSKSNIISVGQGTPGCNIDNEDGFFSSIAGEGNMVAFDIISFKVKERCRIALADAILGFVIKDGLRYCSHCGQKRLFI